MKRDRLGFLGLVGAAVVAVAACGDDEAATSGSGGGGTTASVTTTSTGGASPTSTTSSTGGSDTGVVCELDGKCKSEEHCACEDCWFTAACNTTACNEDGVCDPDESCACADCSGDANCSDYCINCQTYTTYFAGRPALCSNSAPLYDALESCACSANSACLGDCQVTLCNGLSPSLPCQECIEENCLAERDACFADTAEFVKCNPVTQEGCNPNQGNERCDFVTVPANDVLTFAPQTVVGFQCKLETNDATQCTACNAAFGSNDKCEKGNTCVDPAGGLAAQGTCGRYCCEDSDCGTGTCLKGAYDAVAPGLGVCQTGMSPADPGCDAPGLGMSMTMGSCVSFP